MSRTMTASQMPSDLYGSDAFSREDEGDDRHFYAQDRFVSHLDSRALGAVEAIIGTLIVEARPRVLDLMAGWDSHLPETLEPEYVVGLGLNRNELCDNPRLNSRVILDLNACDQLPFRDECFDVVLNVVSVDYLIRPFEVFKEVGRVLRPGGLFLVIFSNRMFPSKAVRIWRDSDEKERILLVEDFFRCAGSFHPPMLFSWLGRPRPADDPYAGVTPTSDPVYAVYAERRGTAPNSGPRPVPSLDRPGPWGAAEVRRRMTLTRRTMTCPYCGGPLLEWKAPDGPFAEWDATHYHVCFDDRCPFYVRGWDAMARQGNLGYSHRCLYHRDRDRFRPIPVNSPNSLRAGIVDAS